MLNLFSDAREGSCNGDVFKVGAGIKGCLGSKGWEGDGGIETFVFEVDTEDSLTILLSREINEKPAGKAAQAGFVEVIWTVGSYHYESGVVVHAIPFAKKLIDEFAMTGTGGGTPSRAKNGVCFVNKNDARGEFFG